MYLLLVTAKCHLIRTSLRAEVVMLFAVERLSERSEDWPTNKKFLEVELNIRAAGLARRR